MRYRDMSRRALYTLMSLANAEGNTRKAQEVGLVILARKMGAPPADDPTWTEPPDHPGDEHGNL